MTLAGFQDAVCVPDIPAEIFETMSRGFAPVANSPIAIVAGTIDRYISKKRDKNSSL